MWHSEDWLIFQPSVNTLSGRAFELNLESVLPPMPFILDFIRSDQLQLFDNFPVYFVNTENYPRACMRVRHSTGGRVCHVLCLSPGKNWPEITICTLWGVSTFSQPRQLLIDWTRTWKGVSFKAKFNFIPCLSANHCRLSWTMVRSCGHLTVDPSLPPVFCSQTQVSHGLMPVLAWFA